MAHQARTTPNVMDSPLVTWVRTLLEDSCPDYSQLCNGSFLHRAWLQIDPNPSCMHESSAALCEQSSLSRVKSWNILLNNVRAFYENVLGQVLVLQLPDVIKIALHGGDELSKSTETPLHALVSNYFWNDSCDEDLRTVLLLILGCAVQCDQKEVFIEKIKTLDIATQHSIVECIRHIHDNPESVFLVSEWCEPPSNEADKHRLYSIFVRHITRLTKERDQLYQRVVDLFCELANLSWNGTHLNSSNFASLKNLSLSNSSLNTSANLCDQKSHYLVELADVKSKLRRVQQELEEKNEVIVELKEIIDQNKEFCNKLRHDNLELTQEARTVKAYRDEIDVLNERCRKIDRLEAEVQKYRDKMNELEFYKSRVDELREDNRILGETKTMLEEQLESSRKRAEKLPELEEKIIKLNAYGNELNLQRELERNQTERLVEEMSQLRQENKLANEELARVQLELAELRAQIRLNNETKNEVQEGNLFEQINQDTSKRMIKLEHENQKLQNLLDDYRNNYVDIDSLLSLLNGEEHSNGQSAVASSTKTLATASEDGECETNCEAISTDSGFASNKSKMEKLNEVKDFIEKLKVTKNSMQNLENIKLELNKEVCELKDKLRDELDKMEVMERNYSHACAENQKYQRIIEQKSKKIEEYMSELSSVEIENHKLQVNADSLKSSLKKLNDLEIEMTNLEGDKHRLEQEKKSLEKEVNRLKLSIEFKDTIIDENASRLSSFELESKKLKKEIDTYCQSNGKMKEIEKENKELLNTVQVQRNTLSTLQQDLVSEKLRAQKYTNEFEKTIETIEKLCTEHALPNAAESVGALRDNCLPLIVNTCFRNALDKCLSPKEMQIVRLQSELNNFQSVNQEMQTVIDSLRKQLNIDTDDNTSSCKPSPLNSLNELQCKITYLEEESKTLKAELNTQKETHSEMVIKCELANSKLASLNERNSELHNENAKLQVENSLLKSQNSSLESQTAQLQEKMASIQESIEKFKLKCEEYESTHKLLIADNESLQEIHQQLTTDYDNLTHSHSVLKQSYKTIKAQNKQLEDEFKLLVVKHDLLVSKTSEELSELKEKRDKEQQKDTVLKEELASLNEEHKVLNEEHKRLQTEHKMLQNIYKKLRSDNNELKLKHTELQGETAECRDRMNALNVEVSKLSNYCEMVALTNNTLEAQRKKLSTQSASLLAQYNDLLLDLSTGCEKSVVDKLRDLCIKKERLEKMFKEYDISIEKNMPRAMAANNKVGDCILGRIPYAQIARDDAIYGRLWEFETAPIRGERPPLADSTTTGLTLRQYPINTVHELTTEKHSIRSCTSPPMIPPRHMSIQRQQPVSLSHLNSHETVIELTQVPSSSSSSSNTPKENKMSINVSTRSPSITIGKQLDNLENVGNLSKLQISSTSNSPIISKSINTATNSYFMRNSFKSNSVNYGNHMRRATVEPMSHVKLNGITRNSHHHHAHHHHSPQIVNIVSGGVGGGGVVAGRNVPVTAAAAHQAASPQRIRLSHTATGSPSFHSDSSTSSHSPLDSERDSDHGHSNVNNNNNPNPNNSNNNGATSQVSNNGNTTSRSRIVIGTNTTLVAIESNNKSLPNLANSAAKTDNAVNAAQLSNVLNNNNSDIPTTGNCTNVLQANENVNSNTSNSIWYEYGCV